MKTIYLDNISTTPINQEVLEEMLPFLHTHFGNPSSIHFFGQEPRKAVGKARKRVADLIGCKEEEIIFTSGATESNNLAIKGILKNAIRTNKKHIITSSIEHYSVLHCLKSLKKEDFSITTLDVDKWGKIEPSQVEDAIRDDTILVTITHASNEIGTLEPIDAIGEITKKKGVLFHTDGAQTVGNVPIDVEKANIDLMTISPHQFYGPKGIGGLFVRSGTKLSPLIEGGIQESGYRAGTENVASIVGMGMAASMAKNSMKDRFNHLTNIRKQMKIEIEKSIMHTIFTGDQENRLPGMLSVCFKYIEGEAVLLFLNMEGIAASSGSACASALKTSHVLSAINIDPATAQGSLIFSAGKDNSEEDIEILSKKLPIIINKLREMSPLYEAEK